MKSWFAQFKISAALDNGRPLPRWLRRRFSDSEELRRFARRVSELDSALRKSPETQENYALHSSIMRAVRAGGIAPRQVNWLHWLPVPATAVVALCGIWWFSHPQSSNRALPSLTSALEAGEQITDTLPAQLVDPLKDEWQRVNLDVENTTRFLLASVPF